MTIPDESAYHLVLTSERSGGRITVLINDQPVALPFGQFQVLAKLAECHRRSRGFDYVSKPGTALSTSVCRFRRLIDWTLGKGHGKRLIETGFGSEYRLDLADAIILETLLPDANDPRTNRLFAELTQLPIILHTSSTEEEADRLAKRIGAQIVRKDEAPEVLDAAVKRVIDQLSNDN